MKLKKIYIAISLVWISIVAITRGLRNTLKKGFKKICENGNKYYFCTRNEGDVLNKILKKGKKRFAWNE